MILDRSTGTDPLGGQGVGSKGQSAPFSEHGHVAYQIKWNPKCINMVANILPPPPPPPSPDPGGGIKWSKPAFLEHGHISYQIK